MFAATSEERPHGERPQTYGKDITRPGSKVKKKAHSPLPPLRTEPPFLSSTFVTKRLFSHKPFLQKDSSDRPLSVVELPRLIAQVGPGRAIGDRKWTEGPRLMTAALGTDIPIRTAPDTMEQSFTQKDESIKITSCKDKKMPMVKDGKVPKSNKCRLSGTEVVQIFTQKKHLAEVKFYYLKEVDGDSYRPYDLEVVQSPEAGTEHYIFSPNYVLHVTERGYGGLVSLAEWYRESLLWTSLQEIRFFRCFRLTKAFTWWHRNVCKLRFQRRREDLQGMLLMAVPQFRTALHLFTRVIEDRKEMHLLPLDESKTYTLLEFKNALLTKPQECLQMLEKLSQYRTVILNVVKEDINKAHQELQLHIEYAAKPNKCDEPLYLHWSHQEKLKKELAQSASVLQKLGNFACLINQMILQSLITLVKEDVIYFHNNVVKRKESQQCCLFDTELAFSGSCQLTVNPPIQLFQEAMKEALLTVGDSIIQMCETSGFFLEFNSNNSDVLHDVTSELGGQFKITGENTNSEGGGKFCCRTLLRDLSDHWPLPPKQALLLVQGHRLHGCYYPLSKTQLVWQISINDIIKHVENGLAKTMQEAEQQHQHLCESHAWLVDIYLFIRQWSQTSSESMKGHPALLYEEFVKKGRQWAERIHTIPSSLSTSNQLFTIHFTHIKAFLGQKLRLVEQEVLEQILKQIQLHSTNLISYLERTAAEVKTEPQDLHNFSEYAVTVRESMKMLDDVQKQLDYIHSLQNVVCTNYRKLTEQELVLETKMLGLWDCFIPLLKQADAVVRLRIPSMSNALDTMSSFLMCELKTMVSKATSEPFIDPSQNAKEMAARLNHINAHVQRLNAKLEQLGRSSLNLQEHTIDMTMLTTDIQMIKARKELWEITALYTTWMEEWKQILFPEVVVSQAQEKVAAWKEQARSLAGIIPNHDPVLKETLGILESVSHQLAVMAKLQSPILKHKHRKALFERMGLKYIEEKKVTVDELMSQQLETFGKLINKVCSDAQTECNMEQFFLKLRQGWKGRLFQVDKFTLPGWQHCKPKHGLRETQKEAEAIQSNLEITSQHSSNEGRFTITGLEILRAEIENDTMTLSAMLKSPYSLELRLQMEDWIKSLQDLEQLLDLFEKYQQTWAFVMKIFNDTFFGVQRLDLLEKFQPVDETFEEIMFSVSTDPHVLRFVNPTKTSDKYLHGKSLFQILTDGLSAMEAISKNVMDLLEAVCEQFPRLWFLSDREAIQLLSFYPTPFALEPFVQKCFKGIRRLEVDSDEAYSAIDVKKCGATSESHRQMKVLGFFANFREHITFLSPLEPNPNALVWLGAFEKQLKLTMVQLMNKCAAVRSQREPSSQDLACDEKVGELLCHIAGNSKNAQYVLDVLSEYPLQCLLVTEESLWCSFILQAFQESSPVRLSSIKAYNSGKLNNLIHSIRNGVSKYVMMCLRALVQLTMNHAQQLSQLMEVQCALESSFEWLSLMKYYVISDDQTQTRSNDEPACYVDVLGHHFQYGYEYFGPEDWVVHTLSTDRAILGILLALKSYRCGFVSGPCMSGKTKTVVHLGKALGRQVAIVQCCSNMKPDIIQKMLLGALHTGALLLLDSVELLTQGVLSSLAQHLIDIHQSFSYLTRNKKPKQTDMPNDKTASDAMCYTNMNDPECHMVLAGKSISANLNYGCVLISSKPYTSVVPESLRYATRSIALTHPDYRIVAEVMLTSIGFSEAVSLSQRLVSLISLAKDSLCLPDFVSDAQCCYLVVLQKIISASEIYFHQGETQQEISGEVKELASQNMLARVGTDRKETDKSFKLRRSHLLIVRAIMEETAIVKALISVLLPGLFKHKKASQFYSIFKDAFPIACQFPNFPQYIEDQENSQLKDAITEELQRRQCHSDSEIICSTLALYQTLKSSQTVLLLGPPGCGKTTCYCALAGALNSLAAKAMENENMIEGDVPQGEPRISALDWNFVDTAVIFPNAMSHEEIFGSLCEKRGWNDGAITRLLRNECTLSKLCKNENKGDQTAIVKWLILDGEPVGQPGWLDYLTTLCNPDDPFIFLSSGEKLVPSKLHLKLLIETSDLSEASPSAVTRCSLVHFIGTELWKAVWKSEMNALCFEHRLDQGTLKMWSCLAEDLFSSTLRSIVEMALISSIHSKDKMYGLQEIMSFARILRAILHYFEKDEEEEISEEEKVEVMPQTNNRDIHLDETDIPDRNVQIKHELFARNLFLVAYVWGFGGHLHPCHWPEFDLLVRQVLFTSRYRIVVPDKDSVFEHFLGIDTGLCPKNTLLTTSITPKYRKYTYLLNLMLDAHQPVLLVGEPGSGKTTLCQTLLSFDKLHISFPASPLLRSKDLHSVLYNINFQKDCKDDVDVVTKQPKFLLFVDDLHEAPCDVFGKTSMALEVLRQSMSMGQILTFDTYCLKMLSTGAMDYMATCCLSGHRNHQSNVISPRLSRLFSIFVLPSLSIDVILSIHSPRLQIWLKEMPLKQSGADMAFCIINATKSLYQAVADQFQPTRQRPHFIFSQRDLHKVFEGMYLWQPDIPITGIIHKNEYSLSESEASVVNIVRLWMHECMRTFSDRLCSEDESRTLVLLIAKAATTHYGISFDEALTDCRDIPSSAISLSTHTVPTKTAGTYTEIDQRPDVTLQSKAARQSDVKKDCTVTEPSQLSEDILLKETSLKALQHMEDTVDQIVFGPELLEPLNSLDRQGNFKRSSSYKEQNLDALIQKLSTLMDRKEGGNRHDHDINRNITSSYFVNRKRVRQLLHILRVLFIPGGHGVLIASDKGTGRKTTVRLAAYLTGYQLIEVHSANENNLHELLKEAGNKSRVDGVHVIILVHEEINQSVREELLVAMAQRTYPAVCTEEELRYLVSKVTAVNNSRKYLLDSWMFQKHLSQVHRNVHVFLLMSFNMSDLNETPANNGTSECNRQMFKAVSLSCCVEMYQPWSNQSLVETAFHCLKTTHHNMEQDGSEASLSVAMAGIHQSACQYASVLLRAQPFNPQTYMEFIDHFGYLCNHLHKLWQDQAHRVSTVLAHLDVMNTTAENYKRHLKTLKEKVAESKQREKELLKAVGDQKTLVEKAEEKCVFEENKLYQLEEQIKQAHIEERPIFQVGLKILKCLNSSDLEEVRHYRDPPEGVVKIMDAVCLLFNHPPGWESARLLLGQPNFFQELEFFDRYSLTNEQLQQLGQIVHSPQFVPASVREVSKACESLCRWVKALYEYCCMQHQLAAKQQLEMLAREKRGQLHLTRQHKENEHSHLEDIELHLQFIQKQIEEQLLEFYKYKSMEEEVTTVVRQVELHARDWTAVAQAAEEHDHCVPGDALILAAVIAFLGPFAPDTRTELLSKWRELCQTGSININPEDPRTLLFTLSDPTSPKPPPGFPISVSERLQQPLGCVLDLNEWQLRDTVSARLLVELLLWGHRSVCVQRWPLLADTQQHLEIGTQSWLITGDKTKFETQFEMVVSANDPELLGKLDQAVKKGLRVLLTHVEHATPSPQFLDRLNCTVVKQHASPEFYLFLSTHLPVRLLSSEIHPSILGQVHVIDLSLSSEEIQELMLTQLLQSECEDLVIRHLQFQNEKQVLQEKLVKEEDALMDYILQSYTPLLQDFDFHCQLAVRQETIKKLQAEIQHLSEELEYHEAVVAAPRQFVTLGAALYQALQEVSRLSPTYYFPLHGFITLMKEVFFMKGRPLGPLSFRKVGRDIVPEITNRMVTQMLAHYRPCLFKNHVAVLKLLVSVTLIRYNRLCSEGDRMAFLKGLDDIDHPVSNVKSCPASHTAPRSTSSLPIWIPSHMHPELFCLDTIPSFRGLVDSLSTSPIQWQQYLNLPSSAVIGSVPCRSHSHLSMLQRALLWKTVVPNCLEGIAEAIAACHLCLPEQSAGSEIPHCGNPEALSHYVIKHEGPIILTLPSSRGETSIQPIHLINKLAHCVQQTQKVQVKVISFGALCEREVIISAMEKAANDGYWLVFNDCHLLDQWDDKIKAHINQLISFKDEPHLIHPCFRMWFITHEQASCSIPAALKMCALPLVCDSPLDLKEELSWSLRQVASVIQCQSLLDLTADNLELLLCCATFHSVLLQRQTYKYLAQERIYNWSQEDLLDLVDAHNCIARRCHDKTKALQYIAVNLVHGGHAIDFADLEVVESAAKTFLSRESPFWGRSKILSDVFSKLSNNDLSGFLQILDQGLCDLVDINDPVTLGFSADVVAEIIKINSHKLNTLLQASQAPPGRVRSIYTQLKTPGMLPAYSHAKERLQALKSDLAAANLAKRVRNAGAVSHSPLCDFLQDEWDDLIDLVSSLLSQLQQPSQYSMLTSSTLLKLSDVSRLERRAQLLSAYLWHHDTSDPPGAYRMSAFKNARGFLVAVIREAAQRNRIDICDIELDFQVVSESTHPASLPLDAVYLCGLELRGASWDSQLRALQDTVFPQPSLMPLVGVKAQVRSTKTAHNSFPRKSSNLMDTSKVSDASPSVAPQLPVYHCPLYVDKECATGDWGLADVKMITRVPLHSRLNTVLCSLRRVRLVSTL